MSDELTRPTYERVPGENMEAGVPWEIVRQTNRRKPLGVGTPEPLYLRDTRTGTVYEGGWFQTAGEARCWVNGWLVAKNWPYVGGEQKEPQPDAAQRANPCHFHEQTNPLDPDREFTKRIAEVLCEHHDTRNPYAHLDEAEAVAEYALPIVRAAWDAEQAWHRGWVAHGKTCSISCYCGPNGEPLACGYATGHDGPHSWASLPTFVTPPTEEQA